MVPRAREVADRDEVRARALAAADRGSAETLLIGAFANSPHAERVLELLQRAARGDDAECRGLVAAAGSRFTGVALFGVIAGTVGGARIHLLASDGSRRGEEAIRERLLEAVVRRLAKARARYARAELPDDPWFRTMRKSLASAGFAEEARIDDLPRDGVALVFLKRDLHSRDASGRP